MKDFSAASSASTESSFSGRAKRETEGAMEVQPKDDQQQQAVKMRLEFMTTANPSPTTAVSTPQPAATSSSTIATTATSTTTTPTTTTTAAVDTTGAETASNSIHLDTETLVAAEALASLLSSSSTAMDSATTTTTTTTTTTDNITPNTHSHPHSHQHSHPHQASSHFIHRVSSIPLVNKSMTNLASYYESITAASKVVKYSAETMEAMGKPLVETVLDTLEPALKPLDKFACSQVLDRLEHSFPGFMKPEHEDPSTLSSSSTSRNIHHRHQHHHIPHAPPPMNAPFTYYSSCTTLQNTSSFPAAAAAASTSTTTTSTARHISHMVMPNSDRAPIVVVPSNASASAASSARIHRDRASSSGSYNGSSISANNINSASSMASNNGICNDPHCVGCVSSSSNSGVSIGDGASSFVLPPPLDFSPSSSSSSSSQAARRSSSSAQQGSSSSSSSSSSSNLHHREHKPRSRWSAVVAGVQGNLGAMVISDDVMRALKYCLQWLQYATNHIDHQINTLKEYMSQLLSALMPLSQPTPPRSPSDQTSSHIFASSSPASSATTTGSTTSDLVASNGTSSSPLSSRFASPSDLLALITRIRREIVETVRRVVDVVGRYAGAYLPGEARQNVRGFILSLPGKWATLNSNDLPSTPTGSSVDPLPSSSSSSTPVGAHSTISSPVATASGSSSSAMTAASEAQKVITFGEESCNMLKGVTSVVSQTVDGAERVLGRVVPVPLLNNNINNSIVSPSPSVLSSSSSPSSLNGFQQQQQQSPAHDVQMVYHPVVVSVVGKGKGKGRATAADNEDIDMTDAHHHHHYGDDSNGEGGMDLD